MTAFWRNITYRAQSNRYTKSKPWRKLW